jgi:hypothetical protein
MCRHRVSPCVIGPHVVGACTIARSSVVEPSIDVGVRARLGGVLLRVAQPVAPSIAARVRTVATSITTDGVSSIPTRVAGSRL